MALWYIMGSMRRLEIQVGYSEAKRSRKWAVRLLGLMTLPDRQGVPKWAIYECFLVSQVLW